MSKFKLNLNPMRMRDPLFIELCHICEKGDATRTYGLGTKRCEQCSTKFDFQNWKKRYFERKQEHTCENCQKTYIGNYDCPNCCEHEFDPGEGYMCLNCGADGYDDAMSSEYDRAEGDR